MLAMVINKRILSIPPYLLFGIKEPTNLFADANISLNKLKVEFIACILRNHERHKRQNLHL